MQSSRQRAQSFRSPFRVLFAGLVLASGFGVASCSPGVLPCDDAPTCAGWGGGGVAGMTGGGAGSGEAGKGAAGKTGTAGAPGTAGMTGTTGEAVTAATTLDCTSFPTVKKFEDFLGTACGGSGCHSSGQSAPQLEGTADLFNTLFDIKKTLFCATSPLINADDPSKSMMLAKVRDSTPKCADGKNGGGVMPSGKPMFTADQIKCMESYVTKIGNWKK